MNKSNLFDQKIRDAVNKHEVPFDDSLWKNIEKEINAPAKAPSFNWKPWAISASIAAALVIAYFAFSPNVESNTEIVEKDKVETKAPINIEEEKGVEKDDAITPLSTKETPQDESSSKLLEPNNNKRDVLPIIEDEIYSEESNPQIVIEEQEELNEADNVVMDEEITIPEEVEENLLVSININKETLCLNEAILVSLNKSNVPVEVLWDFGDGYTAESPSAMHLYDEPGSYILKWSAISVLNDKLVEEESFTIIVNPIPNAQFEIVKSENMHAFPEVSFNAINDPMTSTEWKFDEGDITNSTSVKKMYRSKGVYNVGMVVKNQFQCTDTLYQSFAVENNFNLLAPNAFSPNGDGINDTFIPQAIPYLNQSFTLQIFDPKTSQLLFETSNFDIPWNGSIMNNGNEMKEGAYAWSVKTEDGSIYKGTILITSK